MNRSIIDRLIACLLLLLFAVNPDGITVAAPASPPQVESMDGTPRPVILRLDPTPSTLRIPPPASYTQRATSRVQTATIHVNYLPNGATDRFGNGCLTWPTAAITAFEYAADIWETLINSTVTIEVNACWTNFGDPDILGQGGADSYYRNFTGAPQADTWYPTALANALTGSRMPGSTVDMHVAYGSTFPWYYGTDGSTPTDKVDFASVVLHELCHGLGFSGSMVVSGGVGYWGGGNPVSPLGYDRFTENGAGTALISYPSSGSTALAEQLTGGNLYFDGPNANAANGGSHPKLFAPSTWMQGSSYVHLDEMYNGTANDLMTYALPNGQSTHAPGPIALGILQDIGWPLAGVNTPPTLSGLPDLNLAPGQSRDNAIDLWAYASDTQDSDADLSFAILNTPPVGAGVSIDGDRYIDITPTAGFTGTVTVEIQVTDTGGLTATDSFTIIFAEVPNTPPTLSGLPDLSLGPGQSRDNAIDLWAYASDAQDSDADLSFAILNTPPAGAGVSIDGDRYIDITPTAGFTGTVTVEIQVTDTGGLTDTDTFIITFHDIENVYVYLPVVIRRYPPIPYTPTLNAINNSDGDGNYVVTWSAADLASTYQLQEATNSAFSNATVVYSGASTSWSASGKAGGIYYYRVRGYNTYGYGAWSNVQSVRVTPPTQLYAVADACILQGYGGLNLGSTVDMWVGYDDYLNPDGQIARGLIRFDTSVIPAGTSISSAVLRIQYIAYYDYEGRSRTITSYRIGSNWSESTVTWNAAPSIGEAYGSVSLVSTEGSFGWYSIDVTNLVRGWVNGTLPNYGIMLRGPEHSGSDSSWRSFATRESGSTPYLQITYTSMAATEAELDAVVPLRGYVPVEGTRWVKKLAGESQAGTLCDLLSCMAP